MVRSSTKRMTPVDATPETFASHLADQPGKDISVTREDVEIAKALTAEDLARLPENVSRADLLKIASITDPLVRRQVVKALSVTGDSVDEMIKLTSKSSRAEVAREKARQADAKLSDAEWIATHCGVPKVPPRSIHVRS